LQIFASLFQGIPNFFQGISLAVFKEINGLRSRRGEFPVFVARHPPTDRHGEAPEGRTPHN
jgi:hypothetical protein